MDDNNGCGCLLIILLLCAYFWFVGCMNDIRDDLKIIREHIENVR